MPRRRPTRLLTAVSGLVLLILLGLGGLAPTAAQQVQRIAAVVNDEVISILDLAERIQLVLLSSNLPNTAEQRQRAAPQVLRILIEERLQSQEATRLNIAVTEEDMRQAVATIERNNNLPAGGLGPFAAQNGVSLKTIEEQLRVSVAWQKVLSRRVLPDVQIGPEEIDSVLQRIASNQGRVENRVAEILLPIDNPADEPQVRQLAEDLVRQLSSGANFPAVARQFSKAASAARGGDIGWVQEGQLGDALDQVVSALQPRQISQPVPSPDGYRILAVIDRRNVSAPAQDDVEIVLRQMLISLSPDTPEAEVQQAMETAQAVADEATDCASFAELAAAAGTPQPDEPARLRAGDLNEQLRGLVATVAVNQPSAPLRSDLGIQVIIVCERDQEANQQARDTIRDSLTRQRVDMLSRRYLRDLQRAAFIDLRV